MEAQWAIYVACMGVVWLIGLVFRTLEYTYWWQLKEYRADRMGAHLKTSEGKSVFRGIAHKVRLGFMLVLFLSFLVMWGANTFLSESAITNIYQYYFTILFIASMLLTFWWGYELVDVLRKIARSRLLRPKFTPKATAVWLIIFGSMALYAMGPLILFYPGKMLVAFQDHPRLSYWLIMPYFPGVYLLFIFGFQVGYVIGLTIIDLLLPLLFWLTVVILSPLTLLGNKIAASKARSKIQARQDLVRIGITGSYGKSGTKDMLAAVLSEKYKVHSTPENNNTLIGVARTINRDLAGEHEIFIAEMGAYKAGEIKEICDIVFPQIAIVTGINQQHLSLFGSLGQTQRAKYELVEALSQEDFVLGKEERNQKHLRPFAVFNADNKECVEMSSWYKGRKMFYSAKGRYKAGGVRCQILALDIKIFPERVEFDLVDNRNNRAEAPQAKIRLNAYGQHNINNFLAVACIALEFGYDLDSLAAVALKTEPRKRGIQVQDGLNGSQIISDTYSSNPDGFLAALDYLQVYKGRKIVVTKGIQELGEESLAQHRRVGQRMGQIADVVLLLSRTYEQGLREGLGMNKRKIKTMVLEDPESVVEFLRDYLKKDDVILLEGRMSGRIIQDLEQLEFQCKACTS